MKNLTKLIGIIALVAIIGFSMIACDDGGGNPTPTPTPTPTPGSGQFSGTDVKGNTYSLSVGSDASRAAKKGDRFNMNITVGGSQKTVDGTVEAVSTDGTLTLKADGSAETFSAVVGGTTLNTVTSNGNDLQIPVSGGTFIPRTFDKINLRAVRWDNPNLDKPEEGPWHGENWGSGNSILVKDFANDVTEFVVNNGDSENPGRYLVLISGTSDKDLDYLGVELQGIDADGTWHYFAGGNKEGSEVKAGVPFVVAFQLNVVTACKLADYNEFVLQITNVIKLTNDDHPDWNINNGSIPDNIPDYFIMATISNINISLKDAEIDIEGNMGNYTFGYEASPSTLRNYQIATWELSADNVTKAQTEGTKLEIVFNRDIQTIPGINLNLVWQSYGGESESERGWAGEGVDISIYPNKNGVTYNATTKTLTVVLSTALETYDEFKTADGDVINLLLCFWGGAVPYLEIKSANIVTTP